MQLSFLGGAFSRATAFNANHLLARLRVGSGKKPVKKQGRRRSIPSTTLPAPDIEIGSRHPVNFRMPGIFAVMCEPVHKGGKKFRRGSPWRWKTSRQPAAQCVTPRSLQ
jgi:hypothetical protein